MQERHEKAVSKGFIQYAGRRYWHDDLWEIPGDAKVEIRAQPDHMHPDDIQVIYKDKWVCPAFALDSEAGRKVDGRRVLTAQRRQRKAIQQEIEAKKAILQQAEQQIEAEQQLVKHDAEMKAVIQQEEQQKVVSPAETSNTRSSSPAQTSLPSKAKPTSFSPSSKHARKAWDRVREAKERQKKQEGGQMIDHSYLNTYFDEDRLPSGQKPIEIVGVKDLRSLVEMLLDARQKTGYSIMAVATGHSGVGKSIALQTIFDEVAARFPRGLPLCLKIKAKPGVTPRQMVEDLVSGLGEKPRSLNTNRFRLADQASEVIFNNDLRLLGVDNAEQLDAQCYDFLHFLFAKTGCAVLVVGLKPILRVIMHHEKFENRIAQRLDFVVPSEEDVLQLFLPQLTIPHWTFDPTSEKDLQFGKKLWASVAPSLRSLREVVQNACLLAEAEGKEHITHDMVTLGFHMTDLRRRPEGLERDELEEEETQTEYEDESVRRQSGKKKKQKEEA